MLVVKHFMAIAGLCRGANTVNQPYLAHINVVCTRKLLLIGMTRTYSLKSQFVQGFITSVSVFATNMAHHQQAVGHPDHHPLWSI